HSARTRPVGNRKAGMTLDKISDMEVKLHLPHVASAQDPTGTAYIPPPDDHAAPHPLAARTVTAPGQPERQLLRWRAGEVPFPLCPASSDPFSKSRRSAKATAPPWASSSTAAPVACRSPKPTFRSTLIAAAPARTA